MLLTTLSAWALLLSVPYSLLGQNKGSIYSTQFEERAFAAGVPLVFASLRSVVNPVTDPEEVRKIVEALGRQAGPH